MASVRIDITGGANERSVHLEIDESKEVSSYKVDASTGDVHVYYKRTADTDTDTDADVEDKEEKDSEGIAPEKRAEALTGVVQPSVHVDLTASGNKSNGDTPVKSSAAKVNAAKGGNVTDTDGK